LKAAPAVNERHVVVVRSADEMIAAIPHILGFKPDESVVLIPVGGSGLPIARVDLPRTAEDCHELVANLQIPFARSAGPGASVALICFTNDRPSAEIASGHIATGLQRLGIRSPIRLCTTDDRWVDLNTGQSGGRTPEAADRMALEAVVAGAAQPAASRDALAATLVGDREPLAALLPAARAAATGATSSAVREWTLDRLEQFHADGNRLDGADAARMVVAMQSVPIRDALWEDMSRDNTRSHMALWTDLTRRAPDDVRAPVASLLAFSSWLAGDGVRAWCALDQVPRERPYALAAIVATVLETGLHPRVWEESCEARAVVAAVAADLDESFVPTPQKSRPDQPPPSDPGDRGRGTPSR
jgi:hypothetical protein